MVLEITKNKSLGLLLVLISQTHSVPQHDYKNYLYHYIVKVHDEQAYAQIREKEKENIRFLLKLWLRELTNRIFTKTVISPEDNVVIDKIINEVVKKKNRYYPSIQTMTLKINSYKNFHKVFQNHS
ncbi:MAG: hypothetical protein ACTJLM_01875 [Ehrlichia sp.]